MKKLKFREGKLQVQVPPVSIWKVTEVLPVPTARLFLLHRMRGSQQTRGMGKGYARGDLDGASWTDGEPKDV